MFTIITEGYPMNRSDNILMWSTFCVLSDNMFDEIADRAVSIGPNPDTAIGRLLSDYPDIYEHGFRIIGRQQYESEYDRNCDNIIGPA